MNRTARGDGIRATLRGAAIWANGIVASIGALGLLGWAADIPGLLTFGADFPALPIASALCLLVAAAALTAAQRGRLRAGQSGALLLALIAGAAVIARLAGVTFGLGFRFPGAGDGAEGFSGLISVSAAVAALGVAIAIALQQQRSSVVDALTRSLAAAIAAVAFVALVGLTFRVLLFYSAAPLLGMSIPEAIGFVLLAVSVLAGRPDPWLAGVLTDERPGAVITRWLLPTALIVPLAVGWLRLMAERVGLIDEPLGAGLLTLVMTIVLGALTLWVASELDRMDARRREAERALRDAYAELDRRVIERTAALERATALVHERTRLLGTITASTPDLIVAQDLDGRVLLANPAWLEAMGRTEADALGRWVIDLTRDPEEARRSAEHQRAIVESGHSSVVEEVFTGSGGPRTYLTTKSPLRDEQGRIVGLVGVATDITDRKRSERELESLVATEQRLREEAERANRAKDEFLAIVSHELRSPLNALRGWGHLLASTRPLDPALVERATAAIKRSVEHQARLIDDLLDTARIMSGKLTLEPRPLNLVEVVHAALDTARPAAAAKHVELRAAFDHPVVTVEGDGGRLQQVVTNLLANAIKFTPENGRVEVGVLLAGDRIRLSVHDDGIGIAPEFLPHVFDRFTQADTSTTRRAGGLGIGLALVRHLVELHGGGVRAESRGTGAGATFTIELPAPRVAAWSARAAEAESELRARDEAALAGRKVFVIDDDADARETIGLVLRQAGASVQTFASGPEFAARVGETLMTPERPDVLLLDLAMPEEDGFAVLARVRAVESAAGGASGRRIPAIAVTAFSEFDRYRLVTAGFRDLVAKPVDRARLLRAISAALGETARAAMSAESRV